MNEVETCDSVEVSTDGDNWQPTGIGFKFEDMVRLLETLGEPKPPVFKFHMDHGAIGLAVFDRQRKGGW